jgi:ubiquinone/menaquinone biosynthesis C-methylase UbiE
MKKINLPSKSSQDNSRPQKKYQTQSRTPFYSIASNYIDDSNGKVLDIGCGEGEFFLYLEKQNIPVSNMYLLDANEATVENNKRLTQNSIFYLAPARLPFGDGEVGTIHMSHLVDNLTIQEMYLLLSELDRVLKNGGYLIVSTPMLWGSFYNDLSHTRPYNPQVFHNYLVDPGKSRRFSSVSTQYSEIELAYRYYETPWDEGWSSTIGNIDKLIINCRRLLSKLGFRHLKKNGYTIVFQKGSTKN